MAGLLRITVHMLSGRYHASEWPPSPARLIQALVAGCNTGCHALNWESSRAALIWLEQQPPPEIIVPEATPGTTYRSFDPNNDSDAGKVVDRVRQGQGLAESMRREAMMTTKHHAPLLLPEGIAALHYLWPLPASSSQEDVQMAEQVCLLARRLLALGWGIDVAFAEGAVEPEGTPIPSGIRHVPAWNGGKLILKAPTEGFVADLERAYAAFRQRTIGKAVDADTRPRVYRTVPYRIAGEMPGRLSVAFNLLDPQGDDPLSFRFEDGMLVSAWLRHAARERFLLEGWEKERVDAYVSGHTAKGEEHHRLAYVPLPSIGHAHSDGRIRRVLVVLPHDDAEAGEVLPILHRLAGDSLVELHTDAPKASLSRGDPVSDKVLARYQSTSTTWMTVTPVILHGLDHEDGKFRPRKLEKLLLQAFAKSGYPPESIAEFSYQPAPYWSGAGAARQPKVPKHLEKWPRHHVRVVFAKQVSGPVLVGIGRHYGLGVFACDPSSA